MNTTGEVYMLSEPTENDMPFEEGLSIAREAIKAKFGATDKELDAMGVYPTFLGHGTDTDAPDEPAEWRIYISSRVNTTLDYDTDDVCIHYSYELKWDMLAKHALDSYSGRLFTYVNHLGLYMVSFEPGTTNVVNIALYGLDDRFWPLEVLAAYYPDRYRMPQEGEMTVEEAIDHALAGVIAEYGQEALNALGDYTIGCRRVSQIADPTVVNCRWEVYITDTPDTAQTGWKVHFGEWEDHTAPAWPQLITDEGNR